LPKSFQLTLRGELQFLNDAKRNQRVIGEEIKSESEQKALYDRLSFRTENYIEQIDTKQIKQEQFDIILCLSTIKWIHLNWMDAGVKALFLKAYQQLSEGGVFIFEPQPWKSYKTTKSKTHQQSIKGSTEPKDA